MYKLTNKNTTLFKLELKVLNIIIAVVPKVTFYIKKN